MVGKRPTVGCLLLCMLFAGCDGCGHAGADCEPGCLDLDLDGFGSGCDCSGADCDDYNPEHWDDCGEDCQEFLTGCPCDGAEPGAGACFEGPEGSMRRAPCQPGLRSCDDGVWSPCVGQILPRAEVCDAVDNDCDGTLNDGADGGFRIGGADAPFDCGADRDERLVCADGALTVEGHLSRGSPYIWIPNRGSYSDGSAATVSKVHTETYEEEGRYLVGEDATYIAGISVNLEGAVAVTSNDPSLTRIDAYGCPAGETSTGPDDVRAWGDDACVAWSIMASKYFQPSGGVAWELRRIADGVQDFIWFVEGGGKLITELTADGEPTDRGVSVAPATPGAIAFDTEMQLWVSDAGSAAATLTEIDTLEAEILRTVPMPSWSTKCMSVDADNNVWTNGSGGGGYVLDQDLEQVHFVDFPYAVGLAAGGDQYRWFGANSRVYRVDTSGGLDSLDFEEFDFGSMEILGTFYVAVDRTEQVWGILQAVSGLAFLFAPSEPYDFEVALDTLIYPGACGDMTGSQLAHVVDPALFERSASYRWLIQGCAEGAFWTSLAFDVETPGDSSVEFAVRTAPTAAELAAAPSFFVCTAPDHASPCSIADALSAAGVTSGPALEVEIRLVPLGGDEPVVHEVGVE